MTPIVDIAAPRRRRSSALGALLVTASLSALFSSCTPSPPAAQGPGPVSTRPQPSKVEMEAWRRTILKVPRPREGACYAATYPDQAWKEVTCQAPPHKLYPPRNRGGMTSTTIVGGAGPDFSALVSGHITEAEGSFDSVSISGTECAVPCPNQVCPANPSCAGLTSNQYSLQLNSKPFTTSACSGSPDPATCRGWEQFVYEGSGGGFIQYWLEDYGPAGTQCPAPRHVGCATNASYSDGWCPFQFTSTGPVYCVVNAPTGAPAPAAAVSALGTVALTGSAASGGANDSIAVTVGATVYPASGGNYFPDLGSQWQEVEFNVFGDGGGDQAVFGAGTTLVVRTGVTSGVTAGPSCDLQSFTGESNNLTLVNAAPAAARGSMPALVFSETAPPPGGATASCADATSIGDTHLTTFGGLYYDFQATGDFVLADRGPSFVVQNRQVSGAPRWPNAAVNSAVGARLGRTTVAVCLPGRLEIDGKPSSLADGATLTLPGGAAVTRTGSTYLIADEAGDSLRAEVNDGWINASVGLGRWPAAVRGLLANANDDPNQIATSDGAVLKEPVSFEELYHRYGESWRVKEGESILCGAERVERGLPAKPFYARDLEPELAERSRAVCRKAGVKDVTLLEACVLDVSVLGKEAAAAAFTAQRQPACVAPH